MSRVLCIRLHFCLCPSSHMALQFCHCDTLFPMVSISHWDSFCPGHPTARAPLVPDDPRHGRLLLCLHAAGLNTPQLHCLLHWTLAGQRHGKYWPSQQWEEEARGEVGDGQIQPVLPVCSVPHVNLPTESCPPPRPPHPPLLSLLLPLPPSPSSSIFLFLYTSGSQPP